MIHLVTDSTAYLPPDVKAKYNVHTISLKICVGDQTYDEEGGITQEEFIDLLSTVETAPSTSQPSVGEFIDLFESLTRDGDEVVAVFISEGLSGTVPNARSAAREIAPDRISIVDSRTTASGLMVMTISAGEAIAAGWDRSQVVALLERKVTEGETIFMVEDLAYLHKGGRINTASRLVGTLLNIKPILYLLDGKIDVLDKARSSKRAKRRILDEMVQRMGDRAVRVGVMHILAQESAQELAAAARERLNVVSLHTSQVSPAIGTHVGPGVVGMYACPVGPEGF
jgi:DegV family protein with EDD domain